MKNRIEHWRDRRGLSMQALADKANTTASTISKLEKGGMRLTVEWMEKIAAALDVEPADLLASNPRAELDNDLSPFVPAENDPLAAMVRMPSYRIYTVDSDVLMDLGINPGDRLIVDASPEAIKQLAPMSSVALHYFEFDNRRAPKLLLRQFLPPDKFVANSPEMAQPALNKSAESIEIIGVVVMHPRDFRPKVPTTKPAKHG